MRDEATAWPTPDRLVAAGFKKCATPDCTVMLDPNNVDSSTCSSCRHRTRERKKKRGRR